MKKVLGILNAYDHRNRGDRAIIETQISWLKSKIPDCTVKIFSPAWEENVTVFGKDFSFPPPIHTHNSASSLVNVFNPLFKTIKSVIRYSSCSNTFNECDAYFLCGGGYLYSSTAPLLSRQLWMHVGNSLLALNTGKPVMQFPQSWGPITKFSDRWICKQLASRLKSICSRGEASTQMLQQWGFASKTTEVPDIVMALGSLDPKLIKRHPHGNGGLGIAPIDFGFAMHRTDKLLSDYIDHLVEICQLYISNGGSAITLFPQVQVTGSDEDLPVALEISRRLKLKHIPHRLLADASWENYLEEIANQSVFLGSRMHACIFALISGVPTIGLAYQPKFQSLFSQLKMAERCFPITEFNPADVGKLLLELSANADERIKVTNSVNVLSKIVLDGLDQCWDASGCSALQKNTVD